MQKNNIVNDRCPISLEDVDSSFFFHQINDKKIGYSKKSFIEYVSRFQFTCPLTKTNLCSKEIEKWNAGAFQDLQNKIRHEFLFSFLNNFSDGCIVTFFCILYVLSKSKYRFYKNMLKLPKEVSDFVEKVFQFAFYEFHFEDGDLILELKIATPIK